MIDKVSFPSFRAYFDYTRSDNKVSKLATMCLPWQQWTETSIWFGDVGILAFHSYVVVYLWQSFLRENRRLTVRSTAEQVNTGRETGKS
jgi:hypothetical protein